MSSPTAPPHPRPLRAEPGVVVALGVLGLWAACWLHLLLRPVVGLADLAWAIPGALLLQVLYTGLFITAHDAMHGTLSPSRPRLNHGIGALCCALYAGFSYGALRAAHLRHHDSPGTPGLDPDFHDGVRSGPLAWFSTFFLRYVTLRQFMGVGMAVTALHLLGGVGVVNLALFWVLPSLASAAQLWWVGTYLPHREGPDLQGQPHHARSLDLPPWLSLFACFHFGYHEEHHAHPGAPWWRLPQVRRRRLPAAP